MYNVEFVKNNKYQNESVGTYEEAERFIEDNNLTIVADPENEGECRITN